MLQARRSRGPSPDEVDFFSLYLILPVGLCGPRVDSASKSNEYQESFWGGGGEGRPARKTDNLTAICETTV
jgi:hypothetical protein